MGKNIIQVVVFGYHALYDGHKEFMAQRPQDRPYAMHVEMFEKQMDNLLNANVTILSPGDVMNPHKSRLTRNGVLLTFDDGYISFYKHAFPILAKRSLSAVFFVTSDLVQSGKRFCTWKHLAEMAKEGMWIQSHGKTHRFLSEISAEDSRLEMAESKSIIEDKVGKPVYSISFPGGRFSPREIDIGRSLNYHYFHTSRIGFNEAQQIREGSILKRISIKQGITSQKFIALATGSRTELAKRQVVGGIKETARKLLGSRLYHTLYRTISS